MDGYIDTQSFWRSLDHFRESCPSGIGCDIANEMQEFGKGLEGLSSLFAETDAEMRRLLGEFEGEAAGKVPEEDFGGVNDRGNQTPLERHGMDGEADFEQHENGMNDTSDANGDEQPDKQDTAWAELQKPLERSMRKFAEIVSALDNAVSVEANARQILAEEKANLSKLDELQGRPQLNMEAHAAQTARLREVAETARRLERQARSAVNELERISGAQYRNILRDVIVKADSFIKSHHWTGSVREFKQRAKNAEAILVANSRTAAAKISKADNLASRAKSLAATADARLAELERDAGADRKLYEEIERTANKILQTAKTFKSSLAGAMGESAPEIVSGRKNGGKWELKLAEENTVVHSLLVKRMELVRKIATSCREIEKTQPALEDLDAETLNESHVFPPAVSMGTILFTHVRPGVEVEIPNMVEIPGEGPILVPDSSWIPPILLRLAWALPQGFLEIVALDHAASGRSVQQSNDLSDVPGLFRVATGLDEVRDEIGNFDKYMGSLGTEKFKHGVADWKSFNERHIRHPLPLKVLVVCSLTGFDSWSSLSSTLRKILDNCERNGILAILCEDALSAADERTREVLNGVKWRKLSKSCGFDLRKLRLEMQELVMPEDAVARMAELAETARKRAEKPAKTFSLLFDNIPMWKASSADGLSAPIGWNSGDRKVYFKLDTGGEGGTAVHALVGGQTGSGKSVMLHDLIQSLAWVYSPDELQFYLFDFKNGVEFNKYSDASGALWLPHVKVVSVQNDPRYALELFKHLVEVEFPERNAKFKQTGCTKIGEYVKRGGKMARLVVIVDEFQELFGDHDGEDIGEEITTGLKAIVKQGRSVGVHLVIATQTMASAHATMKGSANDILQQIGLRLALWGTGEELILDGNNKAAGEIIPRKQCILNAKAGLKGGNVVFEFPFASPDSPDGPAYRQKIEAATHARHLVCDGKMFNGSAFPKLPAATVVGKCLNLAMEEAFFAINPGILPDFAATPMVVPFDNLAGEHLLVCGEDVGRLAGNLSPVDAWNGLRKSTVLSLKSMPSCAVLYYNAGSATLPHDIPASFLKATLKTTESELLDLFKKLLKMPEQRKVVFVENFHKAGLLHPGVKQPPAFGSFGGAAAPPPPETARSVFLSAFRDSGTVPFTTILFAKNVKNTCEKVLGRFDLETNILEACGKRITFNVVGDVMKIMIPDSTYQQQHGPRRIWYEDRKTGLVHAFVPYA